ncbi:MAG: hypothetical protein KDC78_01680 [Aequorivita sp.]|nr:hypothetical protein [Aequorivita sp.]
MAQDIKKMLEDYEWEKPRLREGHQERFEAKLDKAFSENNSEIKTTSIPWLKIAAMLVILVAVSFFGYQQLLKKGSAISEHPDNSIVENTSENAENANTPKLTLADISPDLKKVEEYYMTGINVQLASLTINDDNKDLVAGYLERLAELNEEYNSLNAELSKIGPTEATVTALIDNLKMRLDLLFKLKNKLKELKNQNNEEFKAIQT